MSKAIVLKAEERFDSGNADAFKAEAAREFEDGATVLVVDFSETRFIGSVGLGCLVSLLKRAAQCGAKVALCSLSPQVREIFEMTRLHRLFDIFESKEDAVASVED